MKRCRVTGQPAISIVLDLLHRGMRSDLASVAALVMREQEVDSST
jgi:hypothetical protein